MNRQILAGTLILAAVAAPAQGQLNQTTQLAVEITGLNEPQGQVCLNLFDSGTGFPGDRDRAVQTLCVEPTAAPLLVAFDDLAPGSYAVSAFHDANGDSTLNRNFVGMPTEGFGFSRNPEALTGPPDFGEAVVFVAGAQTQIEIELSYF
ncbi:MAG: DUF2141 domain-containing protein [Leptolyngbyaceae cyanobacterium]